MTVRDNQKVIVVGELREKREKTEWEENCYILKLNELTLSINQNSEYIGRPRESLVVTLQRLVVIHN